MIAAAIATVADGRDLSRTEARDVMRVVMGGEATPAQIGGLLIGLRPRQVAAVGDGCDRRDDHVRKFLAMVGPSGVRTLSGWN